MIKVTIENLVKAMASGALPRLYGIRKTISAGHRNRKLPASVEGELKHYEEQRKALIERYHGIAATPDARFFTFPEGEMAGFERDIKELLSQTVELPGEPLKLTDLLDGGLLETDYDLLEPFLTE